MTDKTIFSFTVYDNQSEGRVYWDADIRIEKGEDWLKVLRMLQAAETEIMDIIIKNMGINIDTENIQRRSK